MATMMDKNVRIPFSALIMRPSVFLSTTGVTACLAGGQNTVFAHPIGTYGANATQQLMNGVLSFSSMCVVTAPQSIVHLKNLLITGAASGFTTTSASGGPMGTAAMFTGNHADGKTVTDLGRGDMYILIEPANFNNGKGYGDMISAFGNWNALEQTNGVTFANKPEEGVKHFFNVNWFMDWFYIEAGQTDNSPAAVAERNTPMAFDNMVMFAETFQKFNPAKCDFETRKGAAKGPINPDDVRPGLIESWTSLTPMSALKVSLV